ncbi:MAG TPA: DNA polymerase III subunit beta [Clostridiales bacterium]|nr:MAG: DNA polymerase III subunit beta [Clostridiales bacterium GWD2_32_59]HAN10002.1 DNA polymerase III subunit beta [Clostridiales bacterium]
MNFGLREDDTKFITEKIAQFEEIKKAVIFGSRAKGNYKQGSDIDIAIFGDSISFGTVARLHTILEEESPMPYLFDIVNYETISNKDLKEHIDRVGKVVFER